MKNTSITAHLRAWLNDIQVQDPVDRRIATLLQVVLIGLIVVIILATLVLVIIPDLSFQEKLNVVISDFFGLLVVALPLILLRRGYFRASALIIIIVLFITPTLAVTVVFDLLNSGGILFQFTLAILLAGLLVSRSALAITFGLSAAVVVIAALRGQNDVPQLAMSNLETAVNFILFNGLIALFFDRFGITLRAALKTALERESELKSEINERRRADEALVESEERYRKLINSARDVIFTISADGKITSLNPAFETLTGWSRAQWLGHAFDGLIPEKDRTRAHSQFDRILRGGTVRTLRLHMYTRTGELLVVEMNISPQIKDDQVVGLLGIARDMTQEQHAEDALKASEKRFRVLIENGWDAFTLADAQGTIIYASPSTQRVLGYTPKEFVGINAFTLFHPDDMTLASTKLMEVMQAPGNVITAQVRTRHKDGSWRWMEGVVTNLFAEPDVQALVTNYRDISERKLAEDAVRASEDFRRLIIDTEPECVKLIDPNGSLMEMNTAGLAMLEADSLEQIKGMLLIEIVAPEYRDAFRDLHQHVLTGGAGILEFEIIGLKGTRRWLETHAVPLRSHGNQIDALLGVTRDITEHKRLELELQEEHDFALQLINTMGQGLTVTDKDGRFMLVNPAFSRMIGYEPQELVGKYPNEINIVEDYEKLEQAHIARQQGRTTTYENQLIHKDGRKVPVLITGAPRLKAGKFSGTIASIADLTEIKRVEERIEQQNQRLNALREIDTAILAANSVENIVAAALTHICELIDCRRAAMALIDEETNEVVVFDVKAAGQTSVSKGTRIPLMLFGDMFQPLSKNQPVLINDLAELPDLPPLFQTLRREGLRSICVLPLFSQGSQIGIFSLSSEIPGFFDEERIGLGREVSNQVAIAITQSRLLEALQRLNSDLEGRVREREDLIAELTAKNAELENFTYTVSHDLKSPLVTIKGFLGYLEQDTLSGNVERVKVDTQRIASAVEKMQELLNDLLELSRIGRFINEPESISFSKLAHSAMELVWGRLEERGVTVHIQPNLPSVYVDRQRLTEVLQNLLDNAAKYMGDQSEPQIEVSARTTEDGAMLFYVKDNGIGIAPEYREQVFGLFNKLDARTEGTGVGLALVKRIIEFHRGQIWVESEMGQGSTFFFTLPSEPEPDSVI